MSISSINKDAIQTAPGQAYIAAAPTTVTGATFALKMDYLFALFYTDGAERKTLISSTPWAQLTSEGLKCKLKQDAVELDPNDGPKFPVGYMDLKAEGEMVVADVTAEKLADLLSATSNSLVTFAAATGKAGRKTIGLGGEAYPNIYTIMYAYPSRKFVGEYDHVLVPFARFEVDTDYELSKKSLRQSKVKFTAAGDASLLVNPDTNRPVYWIEDRVTAAAL